MFTNVIDGLAPRRHGHSRGELSILKTRAGAVIGTNLEPISVDIAGAVRATGLGRTKIYEFFGSGKLRSIKIGRRRVITLDAIREMLAVYEANNVDAAT